MLNLNTTDAASTDQIYGKPYLIVNRPKSQMAPWHHGTIEGNCWWINDGTGGDGDGVGGGWVHKGFHEGQLLGRDQHPR